MMRPESIWINKYKNIEEERLLLTTQGFSLRPDLPRVKMKFPFDWEIDPFNDQNWRRQVHMFRMLDPLLWNAWEDINEQEKEYVINVVNDWLAWDNDRASSKSIKAHLAWRDHVVGVRLCKLSYLFQWCAPFINSELMREMIHRHAEFIVSKKKFVDNNHGIYDLHGVSSAIHSLGGKDCGRYIEFVDNNIEFLWEGQFTKSGMHKENSPGYHSLGLNLLEKFLESGFYQHYTFLFDIYDSAYNSFSLQQWPDGRALPLGDTDSKEKVKSGSLEKTKMGLFLNDGRLVYRYYYDGEVCQVVFNCSSYSNSHKHSDNLSILWSEKSDILIDGGKYRFDPGAFRDYFVSSYAHNVPVFHDSMSKKNIPFGYGNALKDVGVFRGGFLASGSYRDEGRGADISRSVLFEESSGIFWVDVVEGSSKQFFSENFLFSNNCSTPESNFNSSSKCAEVSINSGTNLFLYVYDINKNNTPVKLSVASGLSGKIIRGWFSSAYGKKEPCLSVMSEQVDGKAVVALCKDRGIIVPEVELGDGFIVFTLKGKSYKVSIY